jgi:hypothetical protein
MSNITPSSPTTQDNTIMNDLLHQLNNNKYVTDENTGSSPINLSHAQLSALLQTFQQQQAALALQQ